MIGAGGSRVGMHGSKMGGKSRNLEVQVEGNISLTFTLQHSTIRYDTRIQYIEWNIFNIDFGIEKKGLWLS